MGYIPYFLVYSGKPQSKIFLKESSGEAKSIRRRTCPAADSAATLAISHARPTANLDVRTISAFASSARRSKAERGFLL